MMTNSNRFDRRDVGGSIGALFDAWLQTRLQRLYDKTLDEPVPDNLLQLLPEPGERGH